MNDDSNERGTFIRKTAGGIVPFTDETENLQAIRNPETLHVYVYAGADGRFEIGLPQSHWL